MGMTKDEFIRKAFGEIQHRKNEWLKRENNWNDADDHIFANVARIQKRKRQLKLH